MPGTDGTSYPFQMFLAIRSRIKDMEASIEMRTVNDDADLTGRDVLLYSLHVRVGDTLYSKVDSVPGGMAGHWTHSESSVWRRVCREVAVALVAAGVTEGLALPAWLV